MERENSHLVLGGETVSFRKYTQRKINKIIGDFSAKGAQTRQRHQR